MKRLATIAAACASLALLAGCGDDSGAESPLDDALGYLPENAPLAVVIETDLESDQFKAADAIVEKFPFGEQVMEGLKDDLEGGGVDFEDDVEPLLGNEVVVGVSDPGALLADEVTGIVIAFRAEDGGKLEDLAEDSGDEVGDEGDAKLYESDDTFIGIDGEMAVLSDSEDRLREAIKQRGEDDRLRADDVEAALEDLPEDAIARLYGNVGALLQSDESTEEARKVKFVDALDTVGMAASVEEDGITIDFALNADEELEEDELPIASGSAAPPVIGDESQIGVGVRNPAQIVQFAETVAQAVAPAGASEFETAKQQIGKSLGIDIDRDLVGQFTGNVSASIELDGDFGVRAELENPSEFEATLERLVRVIPSFAEGAGLGEVGVSRPSAGEDFYAIATQEGDAIVYGVVDDVFVLATDAERAAELASEQPETVEGAEGAIVVRADAQQLIAQILGGLGGDASSVGQLFAGPLGDIVGSLRAEGDGLRGRFTLEIE